MVLILDMFGFSFSNLMFINMRQYPRYTEFLLLQIENSAAQFHAVLTPRKFLCLKISIADLKFLVAPSHYETQGIGTNFEVYEISFGSHLEDHVTVKALLKRAEDLGQIPKDHTTTMQK